MTIGETNAVSVSITRAAGMLGFFGTDPAARNGEAFTLNSGSEQYDLPAAPTAQEVGDVVRKLLSILGDVSGYGLVNVTA